MHERTRRVVDARELLAGWSSLGLALDCEERTTRCDEVETTGELVLARRLSRTYESPPWMANECSIVPKRAVAAEAGPRTSRSTIADWYCCVRPRIVAKWRAGFQESAMRVPNLGLRKVLSRKRSKLRMLVVSISSYGSPSLRPKNEDDRATRLPSLARQLRCSPLPTFAS